MEGNWKDDESTYTHRRGGSRCSLVRGIRRGKRKGEVCAGVRGGRKCVRPRSFRHYVSFPTCPVFSSTKHVPM